MPSSRFHPLKAGRRLSELIEQWARERSFHPLKAGRRQHIPSAEKPPVVRFHPLKAGRRPTALTPLQSRNYCFHPLKAGRRPERLDLKRLSNLEVSIPSRRVGDGLAGRAGGRSGSVSIPSRRVGDRRARPSGAPSREFPSPQGGSETGQVGLGSSGSWCFHPLKAGRRPRGNEGKGGQKKAKGREGCRRPSVGGKW